MGYNPVTPFGRRVNAAHLEQLRQAETSGHGGLVPQSINKWDMLREIGVARRAFGLSDRDITVLQALISFHPGTDLAARRGEMIVHPSNAAICARLNGMPESTMRRHLARLIAAGLLLRRDSPNGKRYIRRSRAGQVTFGFDLWPLVARQSQIFTLAEQERIARDELRQLRETVSLMHRDLAALVAWGMADTPALPLWTQLEDLSKLSARALRRQPVLADLTGLRTVLEHALTEAKAALSLPETEEVSSNPAEIEQHQQNTDKESYESEFGIESDGADPAIALTKAREDTGSLPLRLVLDACAEVQTYAEHKIRHWDDLHLACETIRPMMGVSADVWREAKQRLGTGNASVVLAAMLERFAAIRSPGAYLRSLSRRAETQTFSATPMVMALIRQAA